MNILEKCVNDCFGQREGINNCLISLWKNLSTVCHCVKVGPRLLLKYRVTINCKYNETEKVSNLSKSINL